MHRIQTGLDEKASKDGPKGAIGLPNLPNAPNGSMDIQGRLERIWTILDMPLVQRLDMVLEYTRKERVLQFEKGLDTWEKAAATVTQREALISQFNAMKQVGHFEPAVQMFSSIVNICVNMCESKLLLPVTNRHPIDDYDISRDFCEVLLQQ